MQERHSRPPFILPGGEAVPACSAYHMAPAPFSPLTLVLSPPGVLRMALAVERCWWNATARFASFLYAVGVLDLHPQK